MKKFLFAFIMSVFALTINANTINQNGIYVTVSPETYRAGFNGYGSYFTAHFSLSSNESVRVHVQITDRNNTLVKDTWVDLTPDRNGNATAEFWGLSGRGDYTVTLIQH